MGTDSVKFAWKAQRDIAERGATMEDVQKAIDARKPDFSAYVEPQKEKADIVIQVLMSDLVDDPTGKFLKVKYIQKKSVEVCKAPFLFDKGSKITWTPNGDKLSSTEGVVLSSYDDEWFGQPVSVVEMDGKVDELEELIYVESALRRRHQVLRRADRADGQEQGRARLGERHRPFPDAGFVQDPRGVRVDHGRVSPELLLPPCFARDPNAALCGSTTGCVTGSCVAPARLAWPR